MPFESLAVDIVGPFPKCKGGVRYVLTTLCLASKWPDAVPLRSVTAKAVMEGLWQIFSRMALPMSIFTDQGSQLTGKLMHEVCQLMGIDKLQTTAYQPQTNGELERFQGTLNSMLTKATLEQLWTEQLSMALFAVRTFPNRDSGFSPYELVFGSNARTPLDLLYAGWRDEVLGRYNLTEWMTRLVDRLETMREVTALKMAEVQKARKAVYDKNSQTRSLEPGDLELYRKPGLTPKLTEAWSGPFEVLGKKSLVNYEVRALDKRGKGKTVHLNNLKKYVERDQVVRRLTMLADEAERYPLPLQESPLYNKEDMKEILRRHASTFSDKPGCTDVVKMMIDVADAQPIAQRPYRVPDKMKTQVEKQIRNLLEEGIIEESTSNWASPVVPVLKPNGSIRVCIDYRRLNAVTNKYYMPTLEYVLEKVGPCKIVPKLDMSQGFHQIEVDQGS